MIGRPPKSPAARFILKVRRDGESGCWIWTSTLNRGGYGQFWDGQRPVYAHRWSYEYHVGPVPDGLQVDHLCRNTSCVNPDHLEPVTPAENTRRGTSPAAANAVKTSCHRGHPLTGTNLIVVPTGRKCRECRLEIYRRYRENRRAA